LQAIFKLAMRFSNTIFIFTKKEVLMTDYILNELSSFRQIFSRERTFQWFCLVILGFILAQDQLGGVTSLVRGLGLETATYHSILNFFGQAIHYQDGLENYIFAWIHNRFSLRIVTINGRPIYVIDSKKIPKQGTKMPGNKTQYQESSSNSKPTFFTGHLFDVIGVLVTTSLGKMLLPFKVRMIDGYKLHNRDTSTLKTRSADIVSMLELKGGILVADAWYACHMFF
jgi:hypothetical protein